MFFQLLFIHLFRPFLKYKQASSPLPAHISPRRFITHSAIAISKLLRLYRRTYGLRQICNIVVYIAHTACTVHLLNLPDKAAQRDIHHGLNHLEEIAEGWPCARRTLGILQQVSKRWKVDLPEAAAKTFVRIAGKLGDSRASDPGYSPKSEEPASPPTIQSIPQQLSNSDSIQRPPGQNYFSTNQTQTFFPPNDQYAHASPASTPDPPTHPHDNLTLPPQSPSSFSRLSRSHHYVVPQTQQPSSQTQLQYQQDQRGASTSGIASPTALFGGVQGLIKDQEWWLRDSNQFFANWNVDPQDDVAGAFESGPPAAPQAQGYGFDWDLSDLSNIGMDTGGAGVGGLGAAGRSQRPSDGSGVGYPDGGRGEGYSGVQGSNGLGIMGPY